MNYFLIKNVHVVLALVSGLGFGLRGFIRLILQQPLRSMLWRTLPHVIDTLLLATGVIMWVQVGWPFMSWLGLKLVLVVLYIGIGIVSFRSRKGSAAILLYILALLIFIGIGALAALKPF